MSNDIIEYLAEYLNINESLQFQNDSTYLKIYYERSLILTFNKNTNTCISKTFKALSLFFKLTRLQIINNYNEITFIMCVCSNTKILRLDHHISQGRIILSTDLRIYLSNGRFTIYMNEYIKDTNNDTNDINKYIDFQINKDNEYHKFKIKKIKLKEEFGKLSLDRLNLDKLINTKFEELKKNKNNMLDELDKKIKSSTNILCYNNSKIYEETNKIKCIVCMDNNKNMIIKSCGHYIMCENCIYNIQKCPMCRSSYSINDLLKVYE